MTDRLEVLAGEVLRARAVLRECALDAEHCDCHPRCPSCRDGIEAAALTLQAALEILDAALEIWDHERLPLTTPRARAG